MIASDLRFVPMKLRKLYYNGTQLEIHDSAKMTIRLNDFIYNLVNDDSTLVIPYVYLSHSAYVRFKGRIYGKMENIINKNGIEFIFNTYGQISDDGEISQIAELFVIKHEDNMLYKLIGYCRFRECLASYNTDVFKAMKAFLKKNNLSTEGITIPKMFGDEVLFIM